MSARSTLNVSGESIPTTSRKDVIDGQSSGRAGNSRLGTGTACRAGPPLPELDPASETLTVQVPSGPRALEPRDLRHVVAAAPLEVHCRIRGGVPGRRPRILRSGGKLRPPRTAELLLLGDGHDLDGRVRGLRPDQPGGEGVHDLRDRD